MSQPNSLEDFPENIASWQGATEVSWKLRKSREWVRKAGERGALRMVITRNGRLYDPASVQQLAQKLGIHD